MTEKYAMEICDEITYAMKTYFLSQTLWPLDHSWISRTVHTVALWAIYERLKRDGCEENRTDARWKHVCGFVTRVDIVDATVRFDARINLNVHNGPQCGPRIICNFGGLIP